MTFDPRRLRFVDSIEIRGRTRFVPNDQALMLSSRPTSVLRSSERRWSDGPRRSGRATTASSAAAATQHCRHCSCSLRGGRRRPRVSGLRRRARGRLALGQDQRLVVQEFAWLTPAAHRALIEVLCAYDLAGSVRFPLHAIDDPLFHHVQEPRLLNCTLGDGAMMRVVDLRARSSSAVTTAMDS